MLSLQDEEIVAEEDINYLKKNSQSPSYTTALALTDEIHAFLSW